MNEVPGAPGALAAGRWTRPLVARTVRVRLHGRANTVRLFNGTAYAPDIDKIQLSALHVEDD